MKIFVLPRKTFIDMDDCCIDKIMHTYNVISINTPQYKPKNIIRENPPFNQKYWKYKNVLIEYFHDCSKLGYKDVIYFDDVIAKQIKQFMQNRVYENTIIHCTAGISRSAAVGYVLNQYFNKDNKKDYLDFQNRYSSVHIPNSLVLQILFKTFNIDSNYYEIKNKKQHEKIDVDKLAKQVGLL